MCASISCVESPSDLDITSFYRYLTTRPAAAEVEAHYETAAHQHIGPSRRATRMGADGGDNVFGSALRG